MMLAGITTIIGEATSSGHFDRHGRKLIAAPFVAIAVTIFYFIGA